MFGISLFCVTPLGGKITNMYLYFRIFSSVPGPYFSSQGTFVFLGWSVSCPAWVLSLWCLLPFPPASPQQQSWSNSRLWLCTVNIIPMFSQSRNHLISFFSCFPLLMLIASPLAASLVICLLFSWLCSLLVPFVLANRLMCLSISLPIRLHYLPIPCRMWWKVLSIWCSTWWAEHTIPNTLSPLCMMFLLYLLPFSWFFSNPSLSHKHCFFPEL